MSDIFTSGDFDKYSKYANLDSARGPIIKDIMDKAKEVARRIHEKYEDDKKDPTGNQNCLLCSWCAEALLRDYNILPRPVYSPRDPALEITPEDMLKGSVEKMHFKNFGDMQKWYLDKHNARFYVHIKWKDGNGGHEFLLLNTNVPHVLDAQQGIFSPIVDIKTFKEYFGDINYNETFLCRIDNHELNIENLKKINADSALVEWDEDKDIPYMKDQDMMSYEENYTMRDATESDLEFVYQSELETVNENKNDPKVQRYIRKDAKESLGHTKIIVVDGKDAGVYQAYATNYYGLREGKRDWWYLAHIYLKPEYRSKGIGSSIIKKDMSEHDKILLQVMKSNPKAKKLYESLGFVVDIENDHGGLVMRYDRSKLIQEFTTKGLVKVDPKEIQFDTLYVGISKQFVNKKYISTGKDHRLHASSLVSVASLYAWNWSKFITDVSTDIRFPILDKLEESKTISEDLKTEPFQRIFVDVCDKSTTTHKKHPKLTDSDDEGYIVKIDISDLKDCIYREEIFPSRFVYVILSEKKLIKFSEKKAVTAQHILKYIPENEYYDYTIQEGAFQDIKNGVNPNSKKLFFHVSSNGGLDGQVFKPRVPDYLDEYDPEDTSFENTTTPRVCFSPSIEGCINAIAVNFMRINPIRFEKLYVYIPEKPINEYRHKSNKELIRDKDVFDANVTGEMWILEPVRLKLYGVIRIDQWKKQHRKNTVPTIKNEKDTRPYYSIRWHWLVKPKVVASTEKSQYNYDVKSVCTNLGTDLYKFKYGLIRNGRLITSNNSEEDYDKYWVMHSAQEVDEAGGGNCYDMVEYEADYLDAYGVKCNKYYISATYHGRLFTHTFVVVPDGDKFIYIERAFKRISDEFTNNKREFDNLNDIFDYIIECMCEYESVPELNYIVIDYTDCTPKVGTDIKHFQDYIVNHGDEVAGDNFKLKKK